MSKTVQKMSEALLF